jgi:uncharacterized protein DUF1707
MRASDRDREQALALPRARCAQGYTSVDTFERRVELTFAASTLGELHAVMAELVGERSRTCLENRRVARALVVPGDELWLGSCPVRLD